MVQKYQEFDLRDKRKNDELSEDYRRITKQYKDLQAKFRHFELADNRKFEEIWSLHEEEVDNFVKQALKADRIINEQQLGWTWRSPDLDIVRNPSLMGADSDGDGKFTIEELEQHQLEVAEAAEANKAHVNSDKLRQVIMMISEEAGFLVDENVKKAIESMPEGANTSLAQAESLLKALGVSSEEDVVALTNHFFIDVVPDKSIVDTLADNDEEAGEAMERLQKLIQPGDVIKAINKFVLERKAGESARGKKTVVLRDEEKKGEEGNKPNEEKEFWNRMSNIVNWQPWVQLEKSLQDYNDILLQRAGGIESVESLQSQNQNLKELLNQYLGSRINEELIVPPTETIKLGASATDM